MKNLEKVLDIWGDLNNSYEKFKVTKGIKTGMEFLRLISGYKDGKTQIDTIKARLGNECSTYTEKEQEDYSKLREILDAVNQFVMSGSECDFTDIEGFVTSLLEMALDNKTVTKRLTDEFLQGLELYQPSIEKEYVDADILYKTKGFLFDVCLQEGSSTKMYCTNPNKFSNIITLKSEKQIRDFFAFYKSQKEPSEFHKKLIDVLDSMMKRNKLTFFKTFVSNEIFRIENNKAVLNFDETKAIPLRSSFYSKGSEGTDYITCSITNENMKYDLVLIP